jgi:lysophospholipase L1-like esterase
MRETLIILLLTAYGGDHDTFHALFYNKWAEETYRSRLVEIDTQGSCDVIAVGDSRVAGNDWGDICNFGIGGDTTFGVHNRINTIIAKQPSKVVIQVGGNDLKKGVPVNNVFFEYMLIVNTLRSAGIEVYINSIIYAGAERATDNNVIKAVNDLLSAEVNYIDPNPILAPDGVLIYTEDGTHLTPEGNELWTEFVNEKINGNILI